MEEAAVRLREMQEELSNFRMLTESAGWTKLMNVADGQLKTRLPSILEKSENLLTITAKEYEKGEIAGITLFMQLPEIAVEGITEEIKQLEEQIEHAERSGNTSRTDDGDADGNTFVGDAPTV